MPPKHARPFVEQRSGEEIKCWLSLLQAVTKPVARRMSALVQKQTFERSPSMSDLPQKRTSRGGLANAQTYRALYRTKSFCRA